MIPFEILNQIADDTGAVYTTFFGEQGEQLLDLNAQDFGALLEDKEGSSEKAYEKAISGPIFKVKSTSTESFEIIFYFRNSF